MAASSSEDQDEIKPKSSESEIGSILTDLNLDDCIQDYSKYIEVNVSAEVNRFESMIEDMLIRLDEFCQTADMIKNESSMVLSDVLPRLNAQAKELPGIFEKIDKLEAFIPIVRKNVDELEEKVNTAEKDLGTNTVNTVKGFLSSLPIKRFRQKKETKPPDVQWTPITFTDLKPYFSKNEPNILDTELTSHNNKQDAANSVTSSE